VMFTTNFRNIVGSQILALSSFGAGMGLAPSDAHGQERIFGFLFKLDNNFTANLAPEHDSLVARRFIREIDPAEDLRAQFNSALNERMALQIRSGYFKRLGSPAGCGIVLSDGSFIQVESSDIPDLKITNAAQLKLPNLTIPAAAISEIRFSPSVKYDLDWRKLVIAERTHTEDLLAIRRPHGKLDTLSGVVISISSEEIEFKVNDEVYRVPHAKIEGLILVNLQKPGANVAAKSSLETLRLSLRYSKISLNEVKDLIHIETPSGAVATVPLSEPMLIDRTRELAISPRDMKISVSRTPNFSEYSAALPISDRPLTLSPKGYSISGSGPYTSLTVNGEVSLEVEVPRGEYSLYFSPKFDKHSPMSFTIRHETSSPSSSFEYTQERFPTSEEALNIRNELEVIGPGKLSISGGKTGEDLKFDTFLLIKD
jgi:hypothetical protein